MIKDKIAEWLGDTTLNVLGDFAELAESFYSIFIITCLIGVYLTMSGSKRKGSTLSSMSFILYLFVRVISNAYAK